MRNIFLTNKDFVGNTPIKHLLFNKEIRSISHAILFYGEEGLGKKTLAKLLACRVMVDDVMDESFFVLKECKLILRKQHPDFLIIGENGNIKIDDIRFLISQSQLKPNQAKNRVCLLLNCDSITIQAQNALLKILEEPPEGTKFILTAKNKQSLIPTILSRVQPYKVSLVEEKEAVEYIQEKYINIDIEDIKKAVIESKGNIKIALELLNIEEKNQAKELGFDIIKAMSKNSKFKIISIFNQLTKDRALYLQVLNEIVKTFDEVMLCRFDIKDENANQNIYKKITQNQILQTTEFIMKLKNIWVFNPNLHTVSSLLAFKMTLN